MSPSEKELISGLQQGDKSVFDFLFRSHYPGLCSFANVYLRNNSAAEEIVQEFFVRLWDRHGRISIHTSLRAYLYQSVCNSCINHLKSIQSTGFKHVDLEDTSIRNELLSLEISESDFTGIFSAEVEKDLEDAIGELPARCRQIFRMCRFENLSYKEVSEKLKVSRSTVKTQMSRAMNGIMKKMEKYF